MSFDPRNTTKKTLYPQSQFESEDDESWQISYLDIITVILGFLIVLLSVSQITNIEETSVSDLYDASIIETEYITTPIDEIKRQLEIFLVDEIENGRLEIDRDLNDVRIRFSSDEFYRSGSASLQSQAKTLLDKVLVAIQENQYDDYKIDVEGHTDSDPISSAIFPSNWELSTARASNVVKYFIEQGIDKKRLKASGYADSRPRSIRDENGNLIPAPNDLNRRVVLRLYYSLEDKPEKSEIIAEADSTAIADSLRAVAILDSLRADSIQKAEAYADSLALAASLSANDQDSVDELEENTPPPNPTPEPQKTPDPPRNEQEIFEIGPRINCTYSVQVGGFNTLNSSFDVADAVEERTGLSFSLGYNNDQFTVRTSSVNSFAQALSELNKVESTMPELNSGLVQNCGNSKRVGSETLQYQIQFGEFNNEQNAIDFSFDLLDEYGVETYLNRSSEKYVVVNGPFNSRQAALEKLDEINEKGYDRNLQLKPNLEEADNLRYRYQIQISAFETKEDADITALAIERSLNINTKTLEYEGGLYYVIVTPVLNSWTETNRLFQRISSNSQSNNPVIYILEYK